MSALDVAAYFRVSTDDQEEDNQRPELVEFCGRRGFKIVQTYTEIGSGRSSNRPQYSQLLKDALAGRFAGVVVWRLDRLGRDSRMVVGDLLVLDRAGVSVYSVREQWLDTAGPMRLVLTSFAATLADLETEARSSRTRAGIALARELGTRSGRPIGRPPADKAKLAKGAALVREKGFSTREAAQKAGVRPTTLRMYMRQKG